MHMFFNSIGYLIYKPVIAEYYGRKAPIIVIPISVILSSAIFCSEKPTFGASTIIFSMIGMYLSKIWQDGHSKRQKYTIMLLIILIMQSIFAIMSLIGKYTFQFSNLIHFISIMHDIHNDFEIENILEENRKRHEIINAPYNPVTGLGAVGERKKISIKRLPYWRYVFTG